MWGRGFQRLWGERIPGDGDVEDSRGSGVQRILDRGVTGGRGFQGKGYRERLFLEGREVWGERIPVERSMGRERSPREEGNGGRGFQRKQGN